MHFSFPIKKRTDLGKYLGIPSKTLRLMELKAIKDPYNITTKAVLTEMIKYWFETNDSASLAAIFEILESKMGMSLDAYGDQVTKGVSTMRMQQTVQGVHSCSTVAMHEDDQSSTVIIIPP